MRIFDTNKYRLFGKSKSNLSKTIHTITRLFGNIIFIDNNDDKTYTASSAALALAAASASSAALALAAASASSAALALAAASASSAAFALTAAYTKFTNNLSRGQGENI